MSKLVAALAVMLFSSYAFSASAVNVQTPPHRSATQEECIKENPKDHQGYLSCIRAKKEQKSNATDSKGSVTVPASGAPGLDNQGSNN